MPARRGDGSHLQPTGLRQKGLQSSVDCGGIEGLIGKSFAAITGKTAEAAVAGGIAAHQHDAGWPAGVALEPAEVNAALGQQPAEGITDGIAAKAAHKAAGVPSRARAQATLAGAPPRRSSH